MRACRIGQKAGPVWGKAVKLGSYIALTEGGGVEPRGRWLGYFETKPACRLRPPSETSWEGMNLACVYGFRVFGKGERVRCLPFVWLLGELKPAQRDAACLGQLHPRSPRFPLLQGLCFNFAFISLIFCSNHSILRTQGVMVGIWSSLYCFFHSCFYWGLIRLSHLICPYKLLHFFTLHPQPPDTLSV